MDSFKQAMANEWLEQLDWIVQQVEENDDGELTHVLDLLGEGRDELKTLI